MKNIYYITSRFSNYFKMAPLAALLILIQQAVADVGVNLILWRGYNSYYGQVNLTTTNPDPLTYHRVESPNGRIWRESTATYSDGSFTNLSFTALLDECTNGVWRLIRNAGDPSVQTNTFSVSLTGVAANMFGDITMVEPLDGAVASANPPEIQWSSTSMFPEIYIWVQESYMPYTPGGSDFLPGTATSWTPPAALTPAAQLLLIQYETNNFAGATFNIISGPTIPGWSASADLKSYLYSEFTVPGSGSQLDIAVESPGLSWTTDGDYGGEGWFVQSNEYSVGMSALQSGWAPDDASSWIETTVMGPGTLSFEWNLLADDNDYFEFTAVDQDDFDYDGFGYDGSDAFGWDYYEVYLEPGPNRLRWTFYNDDSSAYYGDVAFLDNVEYYPEAVDYTVEFDLNIERVTHGSNNYYLMFPSFTSVYPEPITTHEVASPNRRSTGSYTSSSSGHYTTLQDLIDEIEGGEWTLNFNLNSPDEQEYTFTITVDALTTNDLPVVTILEPLDGTVGVATNTGYVWNGPTSFEALIVYARDIEADISRGYANLPVTAINWPGAPTLHQGTNSFDVTYISNNFTGITISEPTDWNNASLASWVATAEISTRGHTRFVVSSGFVPMPVTLLPPVLSNGYFNLSFVSQSGATHSVESTTNLVTGPWSPVTNFPGTGGLELLALPMTGPAAFYRVETQ